MDSTYIHEIELENYSNTLGGRWKFKNDTIYLKHILDANELRIYNSSYSDKKKRDSIINQRVKENGNSKKTVLRANTPQRMYIKNDTLYIIDEGVYSELLNGTIEMKRRFFIKDN